MFGPDLFDTIVDFNDRVFRNIATLIESEDLLDDLSDDPNDRSYGEALVSDLGQEQGYESPIITRPFIYGRILEDGICNYPCSRFSDGKRFGVWYGSLDVLTTIYETVYHWKQFIADMSIKINDEMIAERVVYKVFAAGVLVDLRGKCPDYPDLIANDYQFTHRVGDWMYEKDQNGLLVTSSRRKEGVNIAAFKPRILSDPRHHDYLIYRWTPGGSRVVVESAQGNLRQELFLE